MRKTANAGFDQCKELRRRRNAFPIGQDVDQKDDSLQRRLAGGIGLDGLMRPTGAMSVTGDGRRISCFCFALGRNRPSGAPAPSAPGLAQGTRRCAISWHPPCGARCYGCNARDVVLPPSLRVSRLGGPAARQAWLVGQRPTACVIERYFWLVRVGGIACAGLGAWPLPIDQSHDGSRPPAGHVPSAGGRRSGK